MKYIWNLDPVAFNLFGLEVRWYGIVYVAGFYLATFWGWKLYQYLITYKKEGDRNIFLDNNYDITNKEYENILFWVFLGGIVGGRLGHFLFFNLSALVADPFEVFRIWHGGMAIQGGLIGSVGVALFFFWRKERERWYEHLFLFMDSLVLPLVLTLGFGRIANFMNGELVGVPTYLDQGVVFPHIDEVLRHPVVLYESLGHFLVFLVLLILFYHFFGFFRKKGLGLFLIGYGAIRIFLEPLKAYSEVWLMGLSVGQWLSLVMVCTGVLIVIKNKE